MTKDSSQARDEIQLSGFRRRIRLLRAWRLGAMCGILGAGISAVLALLDFLSVVYFDAWMLAAIAALGVVVGISRALTEPLTDKSIARSVDRRAGLADRLASAQELPADASRWTEAVHRDAAEHIGNVHAAALYPVRIGRWQGAFFGVVIAAALLYIAGNTDMFRGAQQRKDAAGLRAAAKEVQRVAAPQLDAANKNGATAEDKQLAAELRKFTQDLNKSRMTKAEALVRANQLADQAQQLEQKHGASLAESIQKSQTAEQALRQMAGLDNQQMQSMSPLDQRQAMDARANQLNSQMSSVQQQMDAIQKALDSGRSLDGKSPLTMKMRADLQKQLEQLAKLMSKIKLSQQALDFLRKLSENPDFQKAMETLQKLEESQQAQSSGQQPMLTPEQMEAMAKQLEEQAKKLEEMAKKYDTDGQIDALAKEMLEAAKSARLCKHPGLCMGLMSCFGMGPHMNGPSGPGSPWDRWSGYTNKPPMSDKSTRLSEKYEDKVITSQIGAKGDQTYVEINGPSMPTGRSSVPYQSVLPTYEKTAETAMNKTDIPPSERAKVRDYFNSLRTPAAAGP